MTELVVAAGLLVVVMSVVTSLAVRSNRLSQDSRQYRLALDELSNQLERLTSAGEARLSDSLESLSPSSEISSTLPNPVLSAELLVDEYGTRIAMHLSWDRIGKHTPVTLIGWVAPIATHSDSYATEERL